MRLGDFNEWKDDISSVLDDYWTNYEAKLEGLRYFNIPSSDVIRAYCVDAKIPYPVWKLEFLAKTKMPLVFWSWIKKHHRTQIKNGIRDGWNNLEKKEWLISTLNQELLLHLQQFQNKVEDTIQATKDIDAEIRAMYKSDKPVELLRGITYKGIKHNSGGQIEVCFEFDYVICKRSGKDRLFGATDYKVQMDYCVTNRDMNYSSIYASSINGDRINPHIGGGAFYGHVCLGEFDYAVAVAVKSRNWFELVYSLMEFNRVVDGHDEWGREARRNPSVLYTVGDREPVIQNEDTAERYGLLNLKQMATHYTVGKTIMPHEDYVQCAITGTVIPREKAIRLPIYVSEAGLRIRSVPFQLQNKYTKNGADVRRMGRVKRSLITAHDKRNMNKYHVEAIDMNVQHDRINTLRTEMQHDDKYYASTTATG